jgi:hypothetical protein
MGIRCPPISILNLPLGGVKGRNTTGKLKGHSTVLEGGSLYVRWRLRTGKSGMPLKARTASRRRLLFPAICTRYGDAGAELELGPRKHMSVSCILDIERQTDTACQREALRQSPSTRHVPSPIQTKTVECPSVSPPCHLIWKSKTSQAGNQHLNKRGCLI